MQKATDSLTVSNEKAVNDFACLMCCIGRYVDLFVCSCHCKGGLPYFHWPSATARVGGSTATVGLTVLFMPLQEWAYSATPRVAGSMATATVGVTCLFNGFWFKATCEKNKATDIVIVIDTFDLIPFRNTLIERPTF